MPNIILIVTGTPGHIAAAVSSITSALTSLGITPSGNVGLSFVQTGAQDLLSIANAQIQVSVLLNVASLGIFQTLEKSLTTIKTANPGLTITVTYQEQATL